MPSTPSLQHVRLAVAACFFVSGAVVSSWVPHIPGMQRALGMSPGVLGAVLLAFALGALVAMAVSGGLSLRFGAARLMRYATVLYCLMAPLTVLAPHPMALAGVLLLLGLGNGAMGVAMNAEAVEVERAYGRGIMSSFHALYSLGCLVGAAMGGLTIAAALPPVWHLVAVGVLAGLLGVWASFRYLPRRPAAEEKAPPLLVKPTPYLALLGLGAFCSFVVEGAMADWAALYMHEELGASEAVAASGSAAFSLMMLVGRLTGDATTRRFSPAGVVRLGGTLATLGIGLALAIAHPIAAVVGFGLVGAGLATVVPNFLSAAGRETRVPTPRAVAAVFSFGFTGYMAGPAIIGGIAQVTSLPVAMASLMAFSVVILLQGSILRRPPSLPAPHDAGKIEAAEPTTQMETRLP
ncbi:MAG: MFS transporter [Candidatus Sericytochromatia bacterium]